MSNFRITRNFLSQMVVVTRSLHTVSAASFCLLICFSNHPERKIFLGTSFEKSALKLFVTGFWLSCTEVELSWLNHSALGRSTKDNLSAAILDQDNIRITQIMRLVDVHIRWISSLGVDLYVVSSRYVYRWILWLVFRVFFDFFGRITRLKVFIRPSAFWTVKSCKWN